MPFSLWAHSFITFALRGKEGGPSKRERMRTWEGDRGVIAMLIEQPVHKLLTIVARFFVSFIKMPILLNTLMHNVPKWSDTL